MILSLFKWGFISFVFLFVFGDILLMDWVSPMSSGSQADKKVKTGFLGFSEINTQHACLLNLRDSWVTEMLKFDMALYLG